jgi:hypothetical protein
MVSPNWSSFDPFSKRFYGQQSNSQFDFGLSLDHKLSISSLNEQREDTLSSCILRPFQWYLGGPNWWFFSFSTKALNIWDFPTSATPQVGMNALWESLGLVFYTFPHL